MSLVKGFTDILTPINRWTDSAFTRGGGYDSTLTFSSITTNNLNISEVIQIGCYRISMSDVTVTRSNNIISVTCTISSVNGDFGDIVFRIPKKVSNIMGDLTIGAELVSNNNSACYLVGSYGGSAITYYRKFARQPGEIGLSAFNVASSTTYFPLIAFEIPSSEVGKTISFSFKNPFIYEGSYCNPPYKESLDCSPSNPYYLKVKEFPNGYASYQSSPIAMYQKACWGASNAISFFEHRIYTSVSHGTGSSKLVFHKTEFGSGNNDNSILIGRFAITYETTTNSERSYGYAYEFYYQIFGVNDRISAFNGKLTELYKPSGLSVTPSIGYTAPSSGPIYSIWLQIPNNITSFGGKVFLEYTVVSDYGRSGTNTAYSFLQPYYE